MTAGDAPRRVGLDLLEERKPSYGHYSRDLLVDALEPPLGAVLDVGCGEGANADVLRARGATRLAGVEISHEFADSARQHFDEVVVQSVEEGELPWEPQSFDVILCYDVLEHLYDPWSVLRRLRALLRPDGRLHVSVPNARHKNVWMPLVRKGTFNYRAAGLMDVTHIRFFARRDAEAMLEGTGYELVSVSGQPPGSVKRRIAYAVSGGRAAEFFTLQWYLLGRPAAT